MISIYLVCAVALFVLGLVGTIIREHFLQKLVSFNILISGVFLLIIALSSVDGKNDSVATALVLTGLVVSLGASAFGLMLIRAYYKDSDV